MSPPSAKNILAHDRCASLYGAIMSRPAFFERQKLYKHRLNLVFQLCAFRGGSFENAFDISEFVTVCEIPA